MQKQVRRLVQKEAKRHVRNSEPSNQAGRLVGNSGASNQGPKEVAGLVGNAGQSNPTLPMNQSSTPRYRLQFRKDLPKFIYTYNKVKATDDEDVEIAIVDTVEGCIVTSAPLSSAKVEVVVLYGDFGDNGKESWYKKYFRKKIVKSREGKARLLSGKVVISLNQGVGRLKDIEFKDNPRSWTGKKEFKLGLRLHRNEDTEVREGFSSCFRVKDRRVKGNEKHHPPSPMDKVYYLEGIGKNGPIHKRLLAGNISTFQELLQVYRTNPDYLRGLLGSTQKAIAERTWKAITEHACECHAGDERQQAFVENLENCTYQGTSDGDLVQNLKNQAFQNVDSIELFNPPVAVSSTSDPLQQAFHPISAEEMGSFVGQYPSGGWPGVLSTEDPWCHELGCDMPLREDDFCHLSPIQLPPYFTTCQEATTSYSAPAIGEVDHPFDQEGEINVMVLIGCRHQWVRAIAGLKCVILIAKYLAIRRSENMSF